MKEEIYFLKRKLVNDKSAKGLFTFQLNAQKVKESEGFGPTKK